MPKWSLLGTKSDPTMIKNPPPCPQGTSGVSLVPVCSASLLAACLLSGCLLAASLLFCSFKGTSRGNTRTTLYCLARPFFHVFLDRFSNHILVTFLTILEPKMIPK